MHTSNFLLLALAGAVSSLPTFPLERRSLIDVDPTISPTLDLSNHNSCLGLGISVCDPINVGGTQDSDNTSRSTSSSTSTSTSSSSSTKTTDTDDSLLELDPVISPVIDLSSDDSCLGLGISACDPINVGGAQGSNNS